MTVTYEIEIDSDLWTSYEMLCESADQDAMLEVAQCIEEYIVSIQEENEDL